MKETEITDLVQNNGRELYNFCRYLTKDKESADELYQETFLKAIEIHTKIDSESNVKSYLFSIAASHWKNQRRKFARRSRIITEASHYEACQIESPQMEMETPEEKLIEKEQRQMIEKAVHTLKEGFRVPLYLFYTADMSVGEIAKVLHLPEGTVKSRLHKARNEVKKYLEVNGYGR